MPLLCLGLFFEICNTINQHDQKQIHFLSLILLILLDKRSHLMIPLVLLPVINSILSLIVCLPDGEVNLDGIFAAGGAYMPTQEKKQPDHIPSLVATKPNINNSRLMFKHVKNQSCFNCGEKFSKKA